MLLLCQQESVPPALPLHRGRKRQKKQIQEWMEGRNVSSGMLVVYGPNGSGKTCTVKHCLSQLSSPIKAFYLNAHQFVSPYDFYLVLWFVTLPLCARERERE